MKGGLQGFLVLRSGGRRNDAPHETRGRFTQEPVGLTLGVTLDEPSGRIGCSRRDSGQLQRRGIGPGTVTADIGKHHRVVRRDTVQESAVGSALAQRCRIPSPPGNPLTPGFARNALAQG